MKNSFLLLAAGVFLLLSVGGVAVYTATRGLRNNNPGNIRYDGTQWDGLDTPPSDGAFARFVSPEYGIRALARTLNSYGTKYGLRTVQGIITRWAPPEDNNDTNAYIADVAGELGVTPNQVLDLDTYMPDLISAIIKHENGLDPYAANTIATGISMA